MDLSFIKDFFTCQANVQDLRIRKIQNFLKSFPRINMFSLFKQLTTASVSQLNVLYFKKYLTQFSVNLHIVEPNEINAFSNSKDFTGRKSPTDDEILEKGANLFLNVWGNRFKQFSFAEFSNFMTGQQCLPQKIEVVPYPAKKKLYDIFQTQIQGLLNIETLRQICMKQYKNLTDLFQILSNNQTKSIDKVSLRNLYLMHSQRMDGVFFNHLETRLKLNISFQDFLQRFKRNQTEINSKVKQRKVYYSSSRRRKEQVDYFQQDMTSNLGKSRTSVNYQTPKTHKIASNRGISSTRLTKGDKISQLKQASVNVSKFSLSHTPERWRQQQNQVNQPKQIQILGQILAIQESFTQLKRNICYRKDCDLQLIYERQGQRFEELLNDLYGTCNFTSFVRFMVPQDFQHKYLAFVRHQTKNNLTGQTQQAVDQLLEAHDRKQMNISLLWEKIDREMMFRMYCNPCDMTLRGQELNKYFTKRQTKVLLERMDPLKTGEISFENFR